MKSLNQTETKDSPTSATATLITIDDFTARKKSELMVKQDNLVSEFRERKAELIAKSDGFTYEYALVAKMAYFNSGKATPEVILSIEQSISAKWRSISLYDWEKELGFNRMIVFICEILNYFFSSFKTKERIEGLELTKLAAKIYAEDKNMKISELITVLANATKGFYGSSFNRVDEENFFKWLRAYQENKSIQIETERVNNKPEQPNVARLSDPNQEALQAYEALQKAKKEIRDRVNQSSPR